MSTRRATRERVRRGWEHGRTPGRVVMAMEAGYRGLVRTREWLYRHGVLRSRVVGPVVVSIGNLTVGGTGKTPATELAVLTLTALGRHPVIVSRGYHRRSRGIQVVADTASIRLDPEDAGDEPFLLARRLPGIPVVVGSNRHAAARLAVERFGVDAVVLDDGFQHRTLHKDLEIVMVPGVTPWGNGRLLPGGPLREPLSGLARADLIVATGLEKPSEVAAVQLDTSPWAPGVPVLGASYVPAECWRAGRMEPIPLRRLAGLRLLAFAGIAAPARFEQTLRRLGVQVEDFRVFDDHHWYSRGDLARLEASAAALDLDCLVTTEKDWVRLRALPLPARPLYVVSVKLELLTGASEWRSAFERACERM
jgi:tetraacyldisaccharide 4'-kinase